MCFVLTASWLLIVSGADEPVKPIMELQSKALTPGIVLAEARGPTHQVRLLVDIDGNGPGKGTLILDPNTPEFDEFGEHVGGLDTPYVRRKGGPLPTVALACAITFVKEAGQPDTVGRTWRLFRVTGPKIASTLFVATQGPILEGGPARLLIVEDGQVKSVIEMTRFGLVVP